MQNDDKFYRLVCESVDLIVLVKKLSPAQERKLFKYVKKLVKDIEEPLSISKYQRYILTKTLADPAEFFEMLPPEATKATKVVNAVYSTVLQVYPMLDINLLCSNLNNEDVLLSHLGELFKFLDGTGNPLPLSEDGTDPAYEEGDKFSPNHKITSLEEINRVEKYLKRNIVGQEEAIESVIKLLKVLTSGLASRGALFFIGPTGVGKTELGRLLGKRYSGNFMKVNCAEYASAHEYAKLIGAPPGYIGHGEKSMLAEKAEKSNRWVFLFDEIEKAHDKLYDFLLSLLDEGKVYDNLSKELDFSESIFLFTSNQGVSDLRGVKRVGFSDDPIQYEDSREEVEDSVKKRFSPEFVNRIDSFVYFNSLKPEDCLQIAKLSLKEIPIKRYKTLLRYIVENGYSAEYGARHIKRFIKNNVGVKVADMILQKRLPKKEGDMYTPKIVDNELVIVDTVEMKKRKSRTNDISGT
jgi:AAA+ superfamily predicted ATPase